MLFAHGVPTSANVSNGGGQCEAQIAYHIAIDSFYSIVSMFIVVCSMLIDIVLFIAIVLGIVMFIVVISMLIDFIIIVLSLFGLLFMLLFA